MNTDSANTNTYLRKEKSEFIIVKAPRDFVLTLDPSTIGPGKPDLLGLETEDNIRHMNLSNYLTMDPHLLLGLLNTELRNHCHSLEDLVKTHGMDGQQLIEKMVAADYIYHLEQNQFR